MKKIFFPAIVSGSIVLAAIFIEFRIPTYFLTNDFLIGGFQATSSSKTNNDIVIVNIADYSAADIKNQVEMLSRYNPSAIGIDFYSREAPSGDTSRIKFNKLVLPILIDSLNNIRRANNFYSNFADYGFITVYSSSFFEPLIEIDKTIYQSLPMKMLQLHDKNRYDAFLERKNEKEIINYAGNTGDFIYLGDLTNLGSLEVLKVLRGKMILLGYTGLDQTVPTALDNYDAHDTPRGKLFGVVILANILNTLMGEYITPLPIFAITFIVSLVVLGNTIIPIVLRKVKFSYWLIKAIQFVQVALAFVLCSFALHEYNSLVDYGAMVLAIIVAPEVSYWYSVKNNAKG